MKREKREKVMAICILFLAIIGLTVGFLAYSSTFMVESGVSVGPESSDIKLVVYGYDYSNNSNPEKFEELSTTNSDPYRIFGAKSATKAKIDNKSLSIYNLYVDFTEPNQKVSYAFIVRNEGLVDAYLNGIRFENVAGTDVVKKCISKGGTRGLVDKVCDSINVSLEINDDMYSVSEKLDGHNIRLPKDKFIEFFVHIEFMATGDNVDGELSVEFGNIYLDFSSIQT